MLLDPRVQPCSVLDTVLHNMRLNVLGGGGWLVLPSWPHPQQLPASAAQRLPQRAPLWRLDEERSNHSEKETHLVECL